MMSGFFESLYSLAVSIDADKVGIPKAEINDAQMSSLLSGVFAIAGIVAVIFVILGAYRYVISQGNASDLQKGKDMIVYALVGLVIVIFSFAIVQTVLFRIFNNPTP